MAIDHIARLVEQHFPDSASELRIGGLAVGALARRFGTPLFVYDAAVLDRAWIRLRQALPPEFAIYYSVKANPNVAIARHFVAKGAGLEVASVGEFKRALAAGCAAQDILFAGPGKTEDELEQALAHDIGEIHVESEREARRLSDLTRRLGRRARVALRVNPAAEVQGGAMRMGGKPAPFGVDEEQMDDVLEFLLSEPGIEFRGIHQFSGTQILDSAVLAMQYRRGIEIARRVAARLGRALATVDFGGGLGVPYFAAESELDLDKLREEVAALMAEVHGDALMAGTRFLVEPGRFLVGEAGVYVTRVTDIKVSRGKTFVVVDGGMNHHLAASGNLGQVIKRNFPVAVLDRVRSERTEVMDVVGPLCTPLDTLARDVPLPDVRVGDLVGIFQSGAYAMTASPLGFLSHPTPAEVLVDRGAATLIRPRLAADALLPP
jgi:diaminopimelate decarboxylase